jgi:hypothetical protein
MLLATLTANNSMGHIDQSFVYWAKSVKTFISLTTILNYAIWVTSGFTSKAVLALYKLPRLLMLPLVLSTTSVSYLL